MSTTHATTAGKSKSKEKKMSLGKSGQPGATSAKFVTPEQRQQMIAEAAYFIAEHRGFNTGDTQADWYSAESQIDDMLTNQ